MPECTLLYTTESPTWPSRNSTVTVRDFSPLDIGVKCPAPVGSAFGSEQLLLACDQ